MKLSIKSVPFHLASSFVDLRCLSISDADNSVSI